MTSTTDKAHLEKAAEHVTKVLSKDAKVSDRDLHDRLLKQARLVGRLRANPLYPKEVRPGRALNLTAVHILNLCTSCICAHRPQAQVACRDEKCFGLGYLGGLLGRKRRPCAPDRRRRWAQWEYPRRRSA